MTIQDAKLKAGLPGVSVVVFDADANIINTLTTDAFGNLDTSYFLYAIGAAFVGLDKTGYADITFSVPYLLNNATLYMQPLAAGQSSTPNPGYSIPQLAAAGDMANASQVTKNLLPLLGLGALAIFVGYGAYKSLDTGKKKNVSGFDFKTDVMPYVIPGALLVGGYLIATKLFAGLGITQSPEDKARAAALTTDIQNAGTPTMSDSEIAATANQIKEDLGYSSVSNNTSDAAHQLTKVNNTADMLRLVQAYGTHVITFFGIPTGTYTLEETVTRQMSTDAIAEINSYYNAQGINFNF
jgi:hypothetical protein